MDITDITDITDVSSTETERFFADLGLTVTEVARCPDPGCVVCGSLDLHRAA